jgi:hypothetical protein
VIAFAEAEPAESPVAPDVSEVQEVTEPIASLVEIDAVYEVSDEAPLPSAAVLVEEGDVLEELLNLAMADPPTDSARALDLLGEALGASDFPDVVLASAAESMARADRADPVWGWVAVTAAPPSHWDDETIDATVVAFCANALPAATAALASVAMKRLGQASEWEPLDHARWIVRLALAPAGEANEPLLVALLQGIRARPDATSFMADLVRLLFELPPDHEAPQLLLEELEPAGWCGPPLRDVIAAVGPSNIPLSLRRTLVAMAEGA